MKEEKETMRGLDQVVEAENEFFDRLWIVHELQGVTETTKLINKLERYSKAMTEKYGKELDVPGSDFERGMVSGKLSALRWVLGSDWDFLDT